MMETSLKTSLLEKDTLLKEIHHRVKNNLQMITSLLSIQERAIKDEESLAAFRESADAATSKRQDDSCWITSAHGDRRSARACDGYGPPPAEEHRHPRAGESARRAALAA